MKATELSSRAKFLVRKLGLLPHPEGGFYREVHRSKETVATKRGARSALTTIYFLLPKGTLSRLHQVSSDEVWHHYEGAPLRLIDVPKNLSSLSEVRLGPLGPKSAPVHTIPAHHWQAAVSLGQYTLVGCSVGPGFDFADFRLVEEKDREKFLARLPKAKKFL